ncbi:Bug family tripartite tricarboxylate transporter substrate binding protein [Tardiphaga sp. 20_F10_N6_6]|jgi:tripartite-type tricarboxylate transporter receptor subunit TctC|uniref:Tripartite tricarboxylate transporter substrate binding protein n=1 Tax=Tardiphaga robiniae TaxID=943830 RepID=A0A7G6TXM2_9BRAD|nr:MULTISPECIES: tripartite tricarboxylate transporter substrate binding protein [Tardiphaga]QND71504.1 tripartite tricarboxylate transporter substrate binding protein [Tardiphaga robiniae]UFS77756.1 tripartite tricarboxylate transporter substrate binding protein [Tardiphaga sp. 37S4]SNT00152.1 Tripartite-type tricarboxylate transporter, receptor component TctC [Tardiphaga sp. OK246]
MHKAIIPLRSLVVAAALALTSVSAMADYPERPLRVIVPFAAGGATDVIARTVAQAMSVRLGQSIVVENKAGANGNIGGAAAARSEPDGYTLLMATSSHAINASLYQKLSYSLTRDFAALSNLASVPLLLVVHPSVPVNSVSELAAYAKANAASVNYASGGVGTASHLSGEQFSTLAGAKITHVAYKGGAQALNDMIGGQVQIMFANLPEVLSLVQSGKLKALAVTGSTRHAALPDVPAFSETPFPGMNARSWFGLFAPAGTPPAIVEKLAQTIVQSVADPAVQERLKGLGADPVGDDRATFQKYVNDEVARWAVLVAQSGATAE